MKMPSMTRAAVTAIAQKLAGSSKEADRALPSSKGGETPLAQQMYRTDIATYFTESTDKTQLLYSAENWVRVKLELKTSGPVAIGTSATLTPVLSGKGVLLETDELYEAYLAKGTRLYITSQTVNRVNVTVEPIPWLEQMNADNVNAEAGVRAAVLSVGGQIVQLLSQLAGAMAPGSSAQQPAQQMPSARPLPRGMSIPRLTPLGGTRKF